MQSHQIDYRIIGHDMQMVEIELDPGETVIAEAGAMTYLEHDIQFDTKRSDGSAQSVMGKLFGVGKRMLTGESVYLTHFTNRSGGKRRVAFSAPFPGRIVALDLAQLGGEAVCQKDAFLAAVLGTRVDIALHKRLGGGFFDGEGFILQRLRGDGTAFIHAGGTIVQKQLKDQILHVDAGCLVGFSGAIAYDIQLSGGLKSMFFGRDGLFLATLQGTGTVWIQSMPFSRLAERVLAHTHAHHPDE